MQFPLRRLFPPAFALATALLLATCGHVPIASMVKLADFDLLKTDPAKLRVAVRYPVSIRIPEGGAKMMLTLKDKASGRLLLEERLVFVKVTSRAEKAELSAELQEGRRIEIYRLPEDRIPAFRAFQTRLSAMSKGEREKIEGSMEVSVDGCLAFSEKPSKILISTYLRADELGGFIPLLRDVDLKEQMKSAKGDGEEALPRCREQLPEE
ncbi:hypothetical protein [Roseibium sp. M-1]